MKKFRVGDFVCNANGEPELYGIGVITEIAEDNLCTVEWTTEDGETFVSCHYLEDLE